MAKFYFEREGSQGAHVPSTSWRTSNAAIWNEETIMDLTDAPRASSSSEATVSALAPGGYRIAIFEYEYAWDGAENRGNWVTSRAAAASGKSPPLNSRGFTPCPAGQS